MVPSKVTLPFDKPGSYDYDNGEDKHFVNMDALKKAFMKEISLVKTKLVADNHSKSD